jgi:predicted ATPase/serine/threonine protein kinase
LQPVSSEDLELEPRSERGTRYNPSDSVSFAPGTRLGQYEVTGYIGAGGMGEVLLATDTRLDRQVALKVLFSEFALDSDRRRRFMREARAAAGLSHPSVATVYDVGEDSGVDYIAMEYIEGPTLAERITGTTIALDEIVGIGIQIGDALCAAHAHGVVHRDIKPANVMITSRGQVKVLDFGLAKVEPTMTRAADDVTREAATTPGVVMGTVAYMSPEQGIGAPLDRRTDLFSLGVVLYEMATGRRPFNGTTDLHTIDMIRHGEPDAIARYNRNVPAELERIIQKCLEKQPDHRYQSAQDLVIDLQALQRVTHAGPAHLPERQRHNLTAELTGFVGRRKELAQLRSMLASSRLVSLTGAGGAGKTRLAVRLAYDVIDEFPDGVWLADLTPLTTPDLVALTVATAVGVREGPQRSIRDALLENLRHRKLLLVLDNCEHLIDACAELAQTLLQGVPALRIVVTSREALGVPGETINRVPSLSLPEETASLRAESLVDAEATRLFLERATAIDPTFTATSENAGTIARICRRLDGMPLAIELAAARVVVLSLEQIDTRLQDRFRLLTGGMRTAVARQRTLEATVDWSYQLLSDDERHLLCRLSVFPAGWTLEAAEQVCGGDGVNASDMLDLLSKLVGKSLVGVENDVAGQRRYRFLETIRQYARERLIQAGTADRLRERHFEYFFNEFRGVLPILRHHHQLQCLQRIWIEQENVRAALEWALTSASLAEKGLELAGALFWFWTKRGQFEEGRQWLERALAAAVHAPPALRARALIGLSTMHHFQGRHVEVGVCGAEALSLGREAGDAWAVSFALFMRALAAVELGDHEEAAARSLEALDAANATDEVQRGGPLMILANIAVSNGDNDRAQPLYDESIEVHRRAGETWGLGILLSVAAGLRIVRQDFDGARAQASEAMALCQESDDPRGIAWSLDVFAGLLAAGGHADRAARLWGASDALLQRVGGSLNPTVAWIRDRYIEAVKTSLGPGSFETARAEGRAMSPAQAVALARQ